MKRVVLCALSGLSALTICSCNNKVDNKFILPGDLTIENTIKLDNYTLENMINNDESFVLAVLNDTCGACIDFKAKVLNDYIKDTHSIIYSITDDELDSYDNYKNKPYVKVTPEIYIYNEGEIASTLKYEFGKEEFTNLDAFKNYMNEYVIEPKLLNISEDLLDKKISDKESFLLYIGWYKCGDCNLFENRILNDYLLKNYTDNVIYYLESDAYRSSKPNKEPRIEDFESEGDYNIAKANWDAWISFATKYSFVNYRDGKVPVLIYYSNGQVNENDFIVYHNDVIKDGVVTESFFNECIGKSMSEEELLEVHDKKILEFLDKYYKNK